MAARGDVVWLDLPRRAVMRQVTVGRSCASSGPSGSGTTTASRCAPSWCRTAACRSSVGPGPGTGSTSSGTGRRWPRRSSVTSSSSGLGRDARQRRCGMSRSSSVPPGAPSLHAHPLQLAQPGGAVLFHTRAPFAASWGVRLGRRADAAHHHLHQGLQQKSGPVPLDL